jgi:polyisoprenoid-binding protein YceI
MKTADNLCIRWQEGARPVRKVLQRPLGRVALGVAAAVVIAIIAGSVYLFGGGKAHSGPVTAATLAPTQHGTIFTIDASSSEASFTINEVLFGQPNTVVGKTNKVAGQIQLNTADASQSQVGQIKVDLSALVTDNNLRNQTLQSRILETDQPANQYATFTPKSVTGIPSSVAIGQQVSFQITGDLTIHQVTRSSVTFDAQVTEATATQLKGQAQATIKYSDYNLAIPNVPSVTSVSDTVVLKLTFTANT